MRQISVGILGATGLVGQAVLQCLNDLEVPVHTLKLFAGEKSTGKTMTFRDQCITVEKMTSDSLIDLDVLFGAVSSEVSKQNIDMIKQSGVLYIDNSSAFRDDENVPLIIPEINIQDFHKHKIVSNPNCSTILALMSVYPVIRQFGVRKMIVSTYQAVSGAGFKGLKELENQLFSYPNLECTPSVFQQPIVNNCIPLIGTFLSTGFTSEEMKMQNEARKILHDSNLEVVCTCVRVPVLRAHCLSIYLETQLPISNLDLRSCFDQNPGVSVSYDLPTPYLVSQQHDVYVGRIRKDPTKENAVCLWCCGDQIYKGAALNAVQIAQSCLFK